MIDLSLVIEYCEVQEAKERHKIFSLKKNGSEG